MPNHPQDAPTIRQALQKKTASLQTMCPGVELEAQPNRFRVVIPNACRKGHEAHFAELCRHFLDYVRNPKLLPAWEKPNMLAKYFVTTKGVELARQNNAKPQSN